MRNLLIAVALVLAAPISAGVSPTWEQFVTARKTGAEPILPDFSWAGYHDGERAIPDVAGPIFDVTKYGAIPNDEVSDLPAVRRTVTAAEDAGGGVVYFPAGEYRLFTDTDEMDPIRISKGGIVLRGAGFGKDGSILRFVRNGDPEDPTKMYSTPFYVQIKPKDKFDPGTKLARVTAPSQREKFTLTVDSTAKLKPGMRVTLHMQSTEAVAEFLAPQEARPDWTRILQDGLLVTERHRIASVAGNTVTFVEPLRANVNPAWEWTLRPFAPMEEVGVEDLCFYGGFEQDFIHHRSAFDDGAWSILRVEGVANSWIRRCSFINVNHAIEIRSSAQLSAIQLIMAGNPAHFGIHTRAGYGVFGGLIEDRAHMWHGPSVGYQAAGTVYWRCQFNPEGRVDSHSGQPIATLHDNTKGGSLYGSGGPVQGMPHHLRYWTLWNYEYLGKKPMHFDLWDLKKRDSFLMPIVVGFHGTPSTFETANFELVESLGTPVQPESLYEAQLELRLGTLPAWVKQVQTEWTTLRNTPLPEWKKAPPVQDQASAGSASEE
ncbi:DUF4955 domain-containing protein [bacterium]|nr:DUF4955 domain-containing protein [bacterium]